MIEFLLPTLFVSLLLFAAFWITVARPSREHLTRWVIGVALMAALVVASPWILLQVLFTAGMLGLVKMAHGGLAARRIALVPAAIAAVALGAYFQVQSSQRYAEHHERQVTQLREQYPLQSLAPRLAYEMRKATSTADAGPIVLAAEVEQALQEAELWGRSSYRNENLAKIHQPGWEKTPPGRASGFSAFYLVHEINDALSLPRSRSISLSEPPPRRGCEDPVVTPPVEEYKPVPGPDDSQAPLIALRSFHRDGVSTFLNPERFGYVQDREHVAGFEPHSFEHMPALGSHKKPVNDMKLEHVELVSLLKPTGPHAYVSENLPKLDALKTADTRMLHDFEIRALSQLRTDTDVVIEESEGVVRMLGSLRAGNHCIRCHAVQRGELIGALSYEWHRPSAPPQVAQSE